MFTNSLRNSTIIKKRTINNFTNTTVSDWDTPLKVHTSASYNYNIASCEGIQPDSRFIEARCIVYTKNKNPRAIFDDMIISRHKNRIKQLGGKELISFTVTARTSVGKQMLTLLCAQKRRPRIHLDLTNDARIRVGITTTCVNEEDKALLLEMLKIIHATSPIPENLFCALPSLMAETFEETEAIRALPVDLKIRPVFFNNTSCTLKFGGYSFAHFKEDDATIERDLPLIHQAVLNHEYQIVKKILEQNPEMANKKDPWGIPAHRLALGLGPLPLYELFVAARQKCISFSESDRDQKHVDRFILPTWEETGHNAVIAMGCSRESAEIKFAQYKENYVTLMNSPKPTRSILHLACINGDIQTVKDTLLIQPERLNEQDARGYTPLLLAAANGHADTVRWLLAKGASYELTSYERPLDGPYTYCLIDHAATPEVLQAILKVTTNQKTLKQKLVSAIEHNDIRMALRLADYLKENFNYRGLSALDLAMKLSGYNGIELVENLLLLHDEFVPEGPYDTDLRDYIESKVLFKIEDPLMSNMDARIPGLLEEHNKKIMHKQHKKEERIKLHNEYIEKENNSVQLVSEFHSKDLSIQSVFKRVSSLSEDERKNVHQLFFSNFEMMYENTSENKQKYLKKALDEDEDKPAFINLFYENNALIAFMTFELIFSENTIIFHGKLAANANEVSYTTQRLISLSFRAICAIKLLTQENKKVFVYVKAIHPGLGLCAVLPNIQPDFFPKYQNSISESFVQKIVEKTDETMVDGKILAKLRIKNERPIDTKNPTVRFFSTETGGEVKDAMPVCYEITQEVMEHYVESYKHHHIDSLSMRNFALLWDEFSQAKEEYIFCQKAKL